jgi:hypothetical protein
MLASLLVFGGALAFPAPSQAWFWFIPAGIGAAEALMYSTAGLALARWGTLAFTSSTHPLPYVARRVGVPAPNGSVVDPSWYTDPIEDAWDYLKDQRKEGYITYDDPNRDARHPLWRRQDQRNEDAQARVEDPHRIHAEEASSAWDSVVGGTEDTGADQSFPVTDSSQDLGDFHGP